MASRKRLKIATFKVNGIGARLPRLLEWLAREKPDVVALQELKAPDDAFPAQALEVAGYGAIWHGQRAWNGVALLGRDTVPQESRRGLPGDPADNQSRYIEAAVHGIVVGALYLPNGNPQPGPKFEYKLAWMQRLIRHAKDRATLPHPVVLMGDFNVIPTDDDIYDPKSWRKDALLHSEGGRHSKSCWRKGGLMACERSLATLAFTRSGTISGSTQSAIAACALIIYCSIRRWRSDLRLPASTAGCAWRKRPATTHRPGSRFQCLEGGGMEARMTGLPHAPRHF